MALAELLQQLDELTSSAQNAFQSADSEAAIEEARIAFLGKKNGRLKEAQQGLGRVEPQDRKTAGMRFNETKQQIEKALAAAKARLTTEGDSGAAVDFDATLPGTPVTVGHMHPLTQTIEELKDIMARLGFAVVEGPEIEDEWHNFEALNIPAAHPARDPLENFYLATAESTSDSPLLLRSQTSTVQIRVMEQTPPPVRIISLGRVYRPDTADATHYPMFHQMEGLLVDESVTMADLKSVLRMFATSYLGGEVNIRFRPSFFPFTEPSVEADYWWNGDWVEFGGAGMVDPNVLRSVGYDPEQVTGFAFGLGVERLCMRRHNVTDIREFYKNDVRFLHQF
ncbi:MAG: phenylalanine--tRNA ligase subunit alpha [Planctomycetota bacterium]